MNLSQIFGFWLTVRRSTKVPYQHQISKTLLFGFSVQYTEVRKTKPNRTFHLQTPKQVETQLILDLFFLEHQTHPQCPDKVEFQHKGTQAFVANASISGDCKVKEALLLTLMASCMKSMAIKIPNSSPASRVNRLIKVQAPKTANKNNNSPVHKQTLSSMEKERQWFFHKFFRLLKDSWKELSYAKRKIWVYHPVHARKRLEPKSVLLLAKLNMKVYIITVGSATPRINKGWPPIMECITPHNAVETKVWTAVIFPSCKVAKETKHKFLVTLIKIKDSKDE